MARRARTILTEIPYHVTQRGNFRQPVFWEDADYVRYLALICSYAGQYGLEIWSYCLMPNHIHFIVYPLLETALARTFGLGHMRYTQEQNRRQGRVGHLWQGRFFAAPLDELYLSRAARYVERNPVRAGMVAHPAEYPWSSAGEHCAERPLPGARWPDVHALTSWSEFLLDADTEETLIQLRHATDTGRPLGSDVFVNALESRAGIPLRANPRGRPRKHEFE